MANWKHGVLCVTAGLLLAVQVSAADVPEPNIAQVKMINAAITQQWSDYALRPSPTEDDGKWCRRVFLDLIGRIPTYEELTNFEKDRDIRKREKLVDMLLEDSRYTEEYANHWGTIWSNILIGRSGGNDRRSLVSREGMAKYLRDSFASNKPYNRMVYELVTATGTTKPGTEGFNGATNFLVDKVNEEDGTLATSSTSRIFLGLQVQCTQCHNHPFNQWKQQKFWEFNAFFRQTRGLRRFDRVPAPDDGGRDHRKGRHRCGWQRLYLCFRVTRKSGGGISSPCPDNKKPATYTMKEQNHGK